MEKINDWIKKNINTLLILFIVIQPIIDVATAVALNVFHMNITFGIILRVFFLLFMLYTVTFVYKKKKTFIYSFLLLIYAIIFLIHAPGGFFLEAQGLLRVFYFPMLLSSFYEIKEEIKIPNKYIFLTVLIYLFCLLVPMLTNTGFESYEIAKIGSAGWFNAANEISAILAILLPIVFLSLTELKNVFLKIIVVLILAYVFLTIGTKVPILVFLFTLIMIALWFLIGQFKKKNYQSIGIMVGSLLLLFAGFLFLLPKTNFYENIQIHLDYLEVDSPVEIITDYSLIDHFIFSQRLTFLADRDIQYYSSDPVDKILGLGAIDSSKNQKSVEMDYYDIFYNYGILGCFLFFIPVVGIIINLLKKVRKEPLTFESFMYILSFIFVFVLSFFSGHVITAPAVSIYAVLVIIKLFPCEKKVRGKKNG